MRKLRVFNQLSLDGYFVDAHGDMSWAHRDDAEWAEFAAKNAGSGGELVFGRVTYELMAGFWPTAQAREMNADVADGMNRLPKIVFSRTLREATWTNTRLVQTDLQTEMRKLKAGKGPDLVIMGSGTLVSQLTEEGLIDEYQLATIPIILGSGRTLFEGVKRRIDLRLSKSRTFENGNVLSWYVPVTAARR
ncbi:MAG TPA: dihydrofolate reductase family protein [Polyangiaceae bacterium]|nr:dihydrofolate reductase family protein [Polyangiaceae bacterium]